MVFIEHNSYPAEIPLPSRSVYSLISDKVHLESKGWALIKSSLRNKTYETSNQSHMVVYHFLSVLVFILASELDQLGALRLNHSLVLLTGPHCWMPKYCISWVYTVRVPLGRIRRDSKQVFINGSQTSRIWVYSTGFRAATYSRIKMYFHITYTMNYEAYKL